MSIEQGNEFLAPFPLELISIVDQMDAQMRNSSSWRKPLYPQSEAVRAIKNGVIDSFKPFEQCLRELDKKIYFVALPIDILNREERAKVSYQIEREDRPEYYLAVDLSGTKSYEEALDMLNVTPEENLKNLEKTGILDSSPKKN